MVTLKFSHNYPKLWGQNKAELIAMRIIDAQAVAINKDLLEYDTKWEEWDGVTRDLYGTPVWDEGYYPLPKDGKLIQLIFIGNKEIPFCTLRRYTPEKILYYRNLMNQVFDVVITKLK